MSVKIAKFIFCLLVAAALYWFLRPHIPWLDFYEGEAVDVFRERITASVDGKCIPVSEYFLNVRNSNGKIRKVRVKHENFLEIEPGMKVKKNPFSSKVRILYE